MLIPFGELEEYSLPADKSEKFLQSSEYLNIDSNEDWESQGFPGNGTIALPYIVDNIIFNHIFIINSSVYFLIQNCQTENSWEFAHVENGVIRNCHSNEAVLLQECDNIAISNLTSAVFYLDECNNIVVSNQIHRIPYDTVAQVSLCTNITLDSFDIEGAPWGITVSNSYNCTIVNSIFTDCGYWPAGGAPNQGGGIRFTNCIRCTIQNNTFIDNYGTCFEVYGSNFCQIIENYVDENSGAPLVTQTFQDYSASCNIYNNTLNSGLHLSGILDFNVTWNKLGSNGLTYQVYPEDSLNHTFSHNTVLGKPLLFIVKEVDTDYTDEVLGQVIIVNATGLNMAKSEILVSGPGIRIIQSSFCALSEITCGYIRIEGSYRTSVMNSDITGSILVSESSESIIEKNSIRDAAYGILVALGSSKSNISNNIIQHISSFGIHISSSECRIENNTIRGSSSWLGACYESTTPIIRDYGAIEITSDDCLIVNNSVVANSGYGIYITGSSNFIYGNTLVGNSIANGYSNGEDNQWDDGIGKGNFWGDWLGFGIYYVSGPEGCIDRYPNGTGKMARGLEVLVIIGSISAGIIVVLIILTLKIKSRQ